LAVRLSLRGRVLHGYRTGPPACAKSRAKKQPGIGKHAGEKGKGGAENVCSSV
jgi:hypothetical protein